MCIKHHLEICTVQNIYSESSPIFKAQFKYFSLCYYQSILLPFVSNIDSKILIILEKGLNNTK